MTIDDPRPCQLLRGSMEEAPEYLALRAGAFRMIFDQGHLRQITLGDDLVIDRIHPTVRDEHWDTIPSWIEPPQVELREDSFELSCRIHHRGEGVAFDWRALIQGSSEGVLTFTLEGEALSRFRRNRIGFCVLHPLAACAGRQARSLHVDGSSQALRFPEHNRLAAEQPVRGFTDLAGLDHEFGPGHWVELRFEGDAFEMEDQRHWTDASFKTYCTPLRIPVPVEIQSGTRVVQRVTVRARPPTPDSQATAPSVPLRGVEAGPFPRNMGGAAVKEDAAMGIRMTLSPVPVPMPPLGLAHASHGRPLGSADLDRLSALRLAHLRVDVWLAQSNWPQLLASAGRDAMELGLPLELALHLPPTGGDLAPADSALRRARADLARILVFRENRGTTSAADVDMAKTLLGHLGAPWIAGTDGDLYQLQLNPPPAGSDGLCWSMNPQVHAFDDASIAGTPLAAGEQVASMQHAHPGLSLHLGPITLKPRFPPAASNASSAERQDSLPRNVDPRQMSLFGAAWMVAMMGSLSEARADSLTFFETTGWRGIMEPAEGSAHVATFPSVPGGVFPLFHVLADLGEFAGGRLSACRFDAPCPVHAFVVELGDRKALLMASLDTGGTPVRIVLPESFVGQVRVINVENAIDAMRAPESFRRRPPRDASLLGPNAEIHMKPGDYVRVDLR